MFSNPKFTRRVRAAAAGAALALFLIGGATQASAQEMVHRFLNPSFGGNPFYSDHLLSIANIHRPEEPEEPATPAPTQEELIAQQLQARLLSQLSGDILDRIQDAQPGQSGEFSFGTQQVSFTRSQTETRVTFVNGTTGETRVIVLPVAGSSGVFAAANALGKVSAEQALGASGASLTASSSGLARPPL